MYEKNSNDIIIVFWIVQNIYFDTQHQSRIKNFYALGKSKTNAPFFFKVGIETCLVEGSGKNFAKFYNFIMFVLIYQIYS